MAGILYFKELLWRITLKTAGKLTVTNLIASFFRNIGYSEKLGSGARKMFKYGKLYSGVEPEFIEDDVFRIIQPLNENYSFDAEIASGRDGQETTPKTTQKTAQKTTQKIIDAIRNNPNVTRLELSEICGISADGVKWQLKSLTKSGRISRIGGDRGGHWEVRDDWGGFYAFLAAFSSKISLFMPDKYIFRAWLSRKRI